MCFLEIHNVPGVRCLLREKSLSLSRSCFFSYNKSSNTVVNYSLMCCGIWNSNFCWEAFYTIAISGSTSWWNIDFIVPLLVLYEPDVLSFFSIIRVGCISCFSLDVDYSFCPSGTSGVALKSNVPWSSSHADMLGLIRDGRMRFTWSSTCSSNWHHRWAGNSLSVPWRFELRKLL